MPHLLATPGDLHKLAGAESAVFLIGSYDGSGNYGDVLQLVSAIETVGRLPDSPLIVPVVEQETRRHHLELTERYPEIFGAATFAFFADDGTEPDGTLRPLTGPGALPKRALLYVYGGGYLNGWWGGRKVAHAAAVEELAGGRTLPLAASGLQVEDQAVAPGGVGHDLLARAAWVGLRDVDSLEYVRRRIPSLNGRAELAGDDALPRLGQAPAETEAKVNLHVNDGGWISEDAEALRTQIVDVLLALGRASDEPLRLQPVVAYEDPRISERGILAGLIAQHGEELASVGFEPLEPLDVLDDALRNRLASFRRARLTVSCSYHVTLTSLLAGIPAVMLAHNEYYAQKAAGLRELFDLEADMVGAHAAADAAPAAIEALRDGPARSELIAHLNAKAREVTARFDRGRSALSVALADGLGASELELELGIARNRAAQAEGELAAIRATRGWRLLNRLRAARDMMR